VSGNAIPQRWAAARERVPLLSVESTERGPRWTLAKQHQDVSAVLVPTGELIAAVPAPGGDHGKNKPPTLSEQNVIEIRIVRANLAWHVRNVELDGSAAARLEGPAGQLIATGGS
jgi:hypothetical protein